MKALKNRRGDTLVSVISAFSLVLLAVAMVYGCIIAANNLLAKTEVIHERTDKLYTAYYLGELPEQTTEEISATATVRGETLDFTFSIATAADENGSVGYFK